MLSVDQFYVYRAEQEVKHTSRLFYLKFLGMNLLWQLEVLPDIT